MKQAIIYTIGIDATNLRGGGGVTHLVELLYELQPEFLGIKRIVVWASKQTLKALENRAWLIKRNPSALNNNLVQRVFWQVFSLSRAARAEGCDLIFVPGGSYIGNFKPVVIMSQNLLPFEIKELKRYGWTLFTVKLFLLRLAQSFAFRKAEGVIFLTEYARNRVLRTIGNIRGKDVIVSHGLNSRFNKKPKLQRDITDYDKVNPYRILYVSTIDFYKHQWHLVEAVASLRKEGFPLELNLIGPAYPPALKQLNKAIDRYDVHREWVNYHGAVTFDILHTYYAKADLGVFASSCENMPNILLETMASGLPIACSDCGPMPEILGDGGVYFNPEHATDITFALRKLIESPKLRKKLAKLSYLKAQQYSWQRCSKKTFEFLKIITQK